MSSESQMLLPSPVAHHVGWNPQTMRNTLRSPIKCHGGKFYLSASILNVCDPALGQCNEWNEHCAGGANTALQAERRPGVVQIVADSDPLIANVWRVFTTEALAVKLLQRLCDVDVSSREAMEREWTAATQALSCFDSSKFDFEKLDDGWRLALATATIVNSRMSRGGMGKNFAWQNRPRGGQPGEINSWKTFVWNHAPLVAERCRNWFALCADALTLADPGTAPDGGVSNPGKFFYYDPPYVKDTRNAKEVYREDGFDHGRFIDIVGPARAKVAVSGYANPLYDGALSAARGWQRHDFHIVNHSGQNVKKQDRTESLWTNF